MKNSNTRRSAAAAAEPAAKSTVEQRGGSAMTPGDLMRQAGMTAHDYLLGGVHDIDEIMGKGYAKAHPELLAAYIQTAALDFHATFLAQQIGDALRAIGDALVRIADREEAAS
jgi:hypothetical protein